MALLLAIFAVLAAAIATGFLAPGPDASTCSVVSSGTEPVWSGNGTDNGQITATLLFSCDTTTFETVCLQSQAQQVGYTIPPNPPAPWQNVSCGTTSGSGTFAASSPPLTCDSINGSTAGYFYRTASGGVVSSPVGCSEPVTMTCYVDGTGSTICSNQDLWSASSSSAPARGSGCKSFVSGWIFDTNAHKWIIEPVATVCYGDPQAFPASVTTFVYLERKENDGSYTFLNGANSQLTFSAAGSKISPGFTYNCQTQQYHRFLAVLVGSSLSNYGGSGQTSSRLSQGVPCT